MKFFKIYLSLFLILNLLISCNNFQDKLVSELDLVRNNKYSDTFNLEKITDFEWDSCLIVTGNESVPELKEFIEETLNNKKSKIHWEYRQNGVVDKTLKYKAEDLPVNYDRFYFLTPDKKIITKDIDHYGIGFKLINSSNDTTNNSNWISRKNAKIIPY